ncbi:MAG: hypothetical protein ACI81Y_001908 [Glaciecola sp.]|jgi:hypothetical protein
MEMKNSNIIITGGSSGIGKATAEILINKGANALITGRNEKKLIGVANTIGATPLLFDISDLDVVDEKFIDGGSNLYSGQLASYNNQFYFAHVHTDILNLNDEFTLPHAGNGLSYPYIGKLSVECECAEEPSGIEENEIGLNIYPNPHPMEFTLIVTLTTLLLN